MLFIIAPDGKESEIYLKFKNLKYAITNYATMCKNPERAIENIE